MFLSANYNNVEVDFFGLDVMEKVNIVGEILNVLDFS